jgi:tight adherence protein B
VKAIAAGLAGMAAALIVGRGPNLVRVRLAGQAVDRRNRHGLPSVAPPIRAASAVAAGVVCGLAMGGPGLAVLAGAAIGLIVATRRRRAAARRHQNTEAAVAEACLLLAAELRSGAHPRRALSAVAAEWPDLFGTAARRAAVGGGVSSALRAAASAPGGSALSAVAAGWEVSEHTGAALSDVLTAVADSLRADSAARREADAQLSSVRVTARLLAVLPVGTLLLLSGGDSAAMRFLLSTPYGLACLGSAMLLVASGMWWIDRLVRSATR